MVSTGFHIILGIVLANRLFQTRPYAKLALIIVSALPDIDLLGSLVIYLLTQNETATVGFHRTLTHSPIVFSVIFLVGCFLFLIDRVFFDSSKPWILEVTIGLTIGLLVHVGIDLIYFSGVALLWPFSQEHYALFPYSYENFSHEVQKVLSTLDFFVDVGLYLILYAMAIENQTDLKRLRILKWLVWVYGGWVLIFLGLAFFPIERNLYVILQYGLGGLLFLTFTMFLPTLMKETMVTQSDLPVYFNLEKIIFVTVIWAILAIPLSILPNVDFLLVAIFWIGVMVIQFLIFIPAFEMLYRQRNANQ
ncbi:MAG: metal-dependent hydrolase [Candidatus Hermodarchaeota archaeon]